MTWQNGLLCPLGVSNHLLAVGGRARCIAVQDVRASPRRQTLSAHHMARTADGEVQDCLECRMIGTGAMLGISGYFAYLARGVSTAPTNDRRFTAAMSVVFATAAATRWFL